MKIRSSFVSNSSSASFLLSKPTKLPLTLTIQVDLEKSGWATIIRTPQQFEVLMADRYGETWREDYDSHTKELIFRQYGEAMKALAEGKELVYLNVSNESEDCVSAMIYQEGLDRVNLPEGVEVICNDL